MAEKKIAVVIGGGSCPGISPLVYFLNKEIISLGFVPYFFGGWDGFLKNEPSEIKPDFRYLERSGSPVGTSRFKPNDEKIKEIETVLKTYEGIIGVGGNDTLSVLSRLDNYSGARIGIPKTLDNDLGETDFTLGHWSVVDKLVESVISAHNATVDHNRFLVVETIGQDVGWVALRAAKFSGADFAVIPEVKVNIDQILKAVSKKPTGLIIMPASAEIEGLKVKEASATMADGFGSPRYEEREVGKNLAAKIKEILGFDARCIYLGDSVRGGKTCAFDLFLAELFASAAAEGLKEGKNEIYMVGLRNFKASQVSLKEALKRKFVPKKEYTYL